MEREFDHLAADGLPETHSQTVQPQGRGPSAEARSKYDAGSRLGPTLTTANTRANQTLRPEALENP